MNCQLRYARYSYMILSALFTIAAGVSALFDEYSQAMVLALFSIIMLLRQNQVERWIEWENRAW